MTEDNKSLEEKISQLEDSLAELKDEFLTRAQQLKSELYSVRQLAEKKTRDTVEDSTAIAASTMQQQSSGDSLIVKPEQLEIIPEINSEASVTSSTLETHQEPARSSTDDAWNDFALDEIDDSKVQSTKTVEPRQQQPGFLQLLISNFLNSIVGFLLNSLTLFKAPFQEVYDKLVVLYFHYQKQGKAPVFLMTVAGLITLTFGFGYLLQYSFNNLFNNTLKALSGFVIGGGIVAVGMWLSIKKNEFRDYAASIIALGIIFNYLTAYFIGPYYSIVGETTGFLLLLAVTTIAFVLALVFETRVVSAVTLVGGVFMPFIVGDVSAASLVFISYVLILATANIYLSRKIKWPALAQITFVLSLSVIEYVGISEAIYPMASIAVLSGFFYLYTWFFTFDGVSLKQQLSRSDLALLVANIFYFIYAILQISAGPILLASVLISHALVLGLVMKVLRLMQSVMAPLYLLLIGLLIATAVFVLLPADVTSIIWAIEGLSLLYVGFRYSHKLIRVEGYSIYVIAMVSLLWQAILAFTGLELSGLPWHWINLLAFGLLSFMAYRIIYLFKDEATSIELKSAFIQNEIFSVWGAIALSLGIAFYAAGLMTVLAAIPLIWCFYRVSRHQLRFAQLIGFIFLLAFIVQIILGVIESGSFLITQQPVISWIALLELLFFSWILFFYYRYFELSGRGQSFSLTLHELVFYTPLLLTGLALFTIFQQTGLDTSALTFSYPWFDLIVVGGLLATLYGLVLKTEQPEAQQLRTPHASLLTETFSLFGAVFFLYTVYILAGEWMFNAAIIPLLGLMYWALKKKLPYTEKLAWAHFIVFAVAIVISYQQVGNLYFSEQSWSTRLVMFEILLSGWSMLWVYQKADVKPRGYLLAHKIRIAVYCIIPLLFLPRVLRLYPDYFAVALWASFAISWLMARKLKIGLLIKEVSLLFFGATLATVLISMSAINGVAELPGLIALMTGLLVVSVFHCMEKTLSESDINQSSYTRLQLASPYFYGFVVAGLSFALTHQLAVTALLTGGYFLYLTVQRRLLIVTRPSLLLSYGLAWAGLLTSPLLIFLQVFQATLFVSQILVAVTTNLLSITGLWWLTHRRMASLRLLKKKFLGQKGQLWVFHGIVLLVYSGLLNMVFAPWSVGISIAMLIHAVIILFLTLKEKFKCLLRLSIALYGLTAIKVLLHDMNDFGNLHKVFALMGIGSILMLAAFMFQKIRAGNISPN